MSTTHTKARTHTHAPLTTSHTCGLHTLTHRQMSHGTAQACVHVDVCVGDQQVEEKGSCVCVRELN